MSKQTLSQPVELIVRCRAFRGEGVRSNRVKVDDGDVRVWDAVAGHYVPSLTLSAAAERRIRRLAADVAS